MAWRDSFVAMSTYRQSTASTETDVINLSGRNLPHQPATTTEEDNDNDNLESADFLLSVERRVKALRRNTQNDFVLREEDQRLRFRSALQEIAQLQQKVDDEMLHTYVEEDLPNMRDFFALQREDSTNEVFTDNPLLEEHHREALLRAPNSQSFRNILKKNGETWKNSIFIDKIQALKTGEEEDEDEDTVDKFKRRMSGLGKSLKKTLSFRKQL